MRAPVVTVARALRAAKAARRGARLLALVLGGAALAVGGCGLSHTVDRDLLAEISVEYKLMLFDAENEVSIAYDERDRLLREVQERKRDILEAERQQNDALDDGARARSKGDTAQSQLASQAAGVFGLKIRWLEAELDQLRDRLSVQDAFIQVALAKFELAKAKLVDKNNVRGAEKINVAEFEAQVDEMVARAKVAAGPLEQGQARSDDVKKNWMAAREELSKASGGGIGSPWAEDGGFWGTP